MAAIIATTNDYWISAQALNITRNALGEPNRIQASVASGAQVMCYIKGIKPESEGPEYAGNGDGLEYDAGHNYRRWPLTVSPTYFANNEEKYIYIRIPRRASFATQAQVCFPSQLLDIYGRAVVAGEPGEQVGNVNYFYVWLRGRLSSSGDDGLTPRTWLSDVESGTLSTDEAISPTDTDWYTWNGIMQRVTFLKDIVMATGSQFLNLILNGKQLNSVATDSTTPTDSTTAVVTPKYVKDVITNRYLSRVEEDYAEEEIGFVKGLWIKAKNAFGITKDGDAKFNDTDVDGILRALAQVISDKMQSSNFNGDGPFDSGYRVMKTADGVTHMVVDNLFVRMKAIFTELEIRKISYAGGNIIFSHAGSKVISVKAITNELETSVSGHKVTMQGAVAVEGHKVTVSNGHVSGHKAVVGNDPLVVYAYRCYLLKDDGTTATENWWRVDDQARCQTFNIDETGTYHNVENQFYWRRVIGTGTETLEDGKDYDYVDLSVDDAIAGSTVPQAGDQLVQMGNRTDATRQGFITIEVSATGSDNSVAPAFKVFKNVNSYTLDNKRKICISPALVDIHFQKLVQETDYDVARVPMQRSEPWHTGMECYYYDLVQHNGGTWLCTYPESGIGGVMSTTEEPSDHAQYWQPYAQKGEHGANAAVCNFEKDIVSVPVDSSGKTLEAFRTAVRFFISSGSGRIAVIESSIAEDSTTHYAKLGGSTLFANPGKASVSGHKVSITAPASVSGHKVSLPAKGYVAAPTEVIVEVPKGVTLDEHTVSVTARGRDTDGQEYTTYASLLIQGKYISKDGKDGQKGADGQPGAPGEDGVDIIVTPASLLVNQDLNNTNNLASLSEVITFGAMKGTTQLQVVKVQITSTTHCSVTGSANGNTATVTAISKDSSTNNFYDTAEFVATVTYNSSGNLKTYAGVKVRIYANLLGTWKETVDAGTRTIVADKIVHDVDGGVLKGTTTYNYNNVSNAAYQFDQWTKDSSGDAGTYKYINQHLSDAEQNIWKVRAYAKNRFSGAVTGQGWRSEPGGYFDPHPERYVNVDNDGYFNVVSGDSYIAKTVTLERGKKYRLSIKATVTSNITYYIFSNASTMHTYGSLIYDSTTGRHISQYPIELSGTGSLTPYISFGVSKLKEPQIEEGSDSTEFDADDTTVGSTIKQTANQITAKVQNTGVDITNGLIRLTGGKVEIEESVEVPTVLSMNNDMYTQIQAGGLEIRSKKSSSFGLFQLNSNNEIILTMYDANGNCVVSLGGTPSVQINGEWKTMKLKAVDPSVVSGGLSEFTNNGDGISTYQLRLGKTTNSGSVLQYFTPSGLETTDSTVKGRDNCVFTSKTGTSYTNVSQENSAIAALSPISMGWYVLPNNGHFMQDIDTGKYRVMIYQYNSSGRLIQTLEHQFTA